MIVYRPQIFPLGCIHHNSRSTSFPALVGLWKDRGYCEVVESKNPFFWVGGVGDVLLYSWDALHQLNPHQKYNVGLFANAAPPVNGRDNRRWTFWTRQPFVIESYFACKPLTSGQRKINCIFIGGYENLVQRGYRFFDYWKPALDFCDIGIRGGNYTWQEYSRLLRQSKFGLCLRGSGPKCHREIELMAMGTVPIVAPGVDMDGYFNPPVIGQHYFRARGVEDVMDLVSSTSEKQWAEMSWQCREWYWKNASPIGAFNVTKQIVDGLTQEKDCQPENPM